MGEEVKKISFGFSKFSKKATIVSSQLNEAKPPKSDIELIDCIEGKSIKLKEPLKCEPNILVIPLKKLTEDASVRQHVDSKTILEDIDGTSRSQVNNIGKQDTNNLGSEPSLSNQINEATIASNDMAISTNLACKKLTLDEIAAKEIIEELNSKKNDGEARIFTVPLTSNPPTGESESTLDDYDSIPVNAFGMAMLRGMGWAPGKGIGKNEKSVSVKLPTVRPKGMGLGADKAIKEASNNRNIDENLKMAKGSYIRVVAGTHKDSYGQIEGFDDESGRLIVKLALKNVAVSLNEFMVVLVDKTEFIKNSKVINVAKYEQYKDDESKKIPNPKQLEKTASKQSIQDERSVTTSKFNRSKHDKPKQNSSLSESEASDGESTATADKTFSRDAMERPSKSVSKIDSGSEDNNLRNRHSRSLSIGNTSHSTDRNVISKKTGGDNSHRSVERSTNRHRYNSESSGTTSSTNHSSSNKRNKKKDHKKKLRYRSSSSDRSTSSGCYSRKEKSRTKRKKPSSHKYKSRSRSRSPRKKSSHNKHKKSSYK
uniref:G-patch domain-containing protein n=1 Tax=Graphocephala atropunctata TaxID=36148 RepID=A0A1B6MA96_9HEMI